MKIILLLFNTISLLLELEQWPNTKAALLYLCSIKLSTIQLKMGYSTMYGSDISNLFQKLYIIIIPSLSFKLETGNNRVENHTF